jgi:hypothetical protein
MKRAGFDLASEMTAGSVPIMTFDTFAHEIVGVAGGTVLVRRGGRGPGVLLLHGYPETSLAWRKVAPALASERAWPSRQCSGPWVRSTERIGSISSTTERIGRRLDESCARYSRPGHLED